MEVYCNVANCKIFARYSLRRYVGARIGCLAITLFVLFVEVSDIYVESMDNMKRIYNRDCIQESRNSEIVLKNIDKTCIVW